MSEVEEVEVAPPEPKKKRKPEPKKKRKADSGEGAPEPSPAKAAEEPETASQKPELAAGKTLASVVAGLGAAQREEFLSFARAGFDENAVIPRAASPNMIRRVRLRSIVEFVRPHTGARPDLVRRIEQAPEVDIEVAFSIVLTAFGNDQAVAHAGASRAALAILRDGEVERRAQAIALAIDNLPQAAE